jgi:hypothetical protein
MNTKYIISLTALMALCVFTYAQKVDKLTALRTSKKIISVSELSHQPDYAIQIIALKYPAEEPAFFKKVEEAREFDCADGFVRYTVGSFSSYKAAQGELIYYKDLGYHQAFVVNTSAYTLKGDRKQNTNFIPDLNKSYTIQLSAFRFPVYLSYFKGVDNVMEFYLKDKIYRYTVGKYPYDQAVSDLGRYKAMGFKSAFVTELDAYLPYQIE